MADVTWGPGPPAKGPGEGARTVRATAAMGPGGEDNLGRGHTQILDKVSTKAS